MAKVLTAAAVEKFKPTDGRQEIPDARMQGLYLVVQPSGAKSWAVRYRLNGKPAKFTLGKYPRVELGDARKAAGAALELVTKGEDPAAQRKAATATTPEPDTFERIAHDYERRGFPNAKRKAKTLAPRTLDEYRRQLKLLRQTWQGRLVADIRKPDVLDVLDDITENRGPVEANRVYALLSKFFGWWCARQDPSPASPMAAIAKPSEEASRERVLSDDEIRRLWAAFDQLGYPFGPWAKLLLLTGQRRHAVATMRWQDLDLEAGTWTLRQKGDRVLLVPLVPAVVAILEALPRFNGPFVFSTTAGQRPISGYSVAKGRVARILAKIETDHRPLPQWQWHDCRRTLRTNLSRLKVEEHVAELVLGHAIGGMTKVYNLWSFADEKRDALDRWAMFLAGLVTPNVVQFKQAAG